MAAFHKQHNEISALLKNRLQENGEVSGTAVSLQVENPRRANSPDLPTKVYDEFTLFLNLPTELQMRILEIACFENPRVVQISMYQKKGLNRYQSPSAYNCLGNGYHCFKNYPPVLLHASPVTRRILLKSGWYKKRQVDLSKSAPIDDNDQKTPYIYFNFDVDILYLPRLDRTWCDVNRIKWAQFITESRTLSEFRRVAISNSAKSDDVFRQDWIVSANFLSQSRSKIEEVSVVMDMIDPAKAGDLELVPVGDDCVVEYLRPQYPGQTRRPARKVEDLVEMISKFLVRTQAKGQEDEGDGARRDAQKTPIKVSYVEPKFLPHSSNSRTLSA